MCVGVGVLARGRVGALASVSSLPCRHATAWILDLGAVEAKPHHRLRSRAACTRHNGMEGPPGTCGATSAAQPLHCGATTPVRRNHSSVAQPVWCSCVRCIPPTLPDTAFNALSCPHPHLGCCSRSRSLLHCKRTQTNTHACFAHEHKHNLQTLHRLQECMAGNDIGAGGKDALTGKPYNTLEIAAVWRIENQTLWAKYAAEKMQTSV